MNRRSRMKSTLDSLFSSNKSQAENPETPATPAPSAPTPEKKPEKPVEKPASSPVVKAPAKKAAPAAAKAKLVVKPTPAAVKKPEAAAPAAKPDVKPAAASQPETKLPAPAPIAVTPPQIEKTPEPPKMPAPVASTPAPVSVEKPVSNPPVKTESAAASAQNAPKNGGHEVEDSDEEVHLVVFLLAGEAFGIGIHMVESIIKKQAITKVPHAEKFILGVTNLRGTVVPVVDLRQRFALETTEATKDTRIIVLNTESGKNGIVVDEVMEVLRIPKSAIAPTPTITTTVNSAFIKGIARTEERLIILLDVNSILVN
jgi:purine-binding chemotaxis protein CheW